MASYVKQPGDFGKFENENQNRFVLLSIATRKMLRSEHPITHSQWGFANITAFSKCSLMPQLFIAGFLTQQQYGNLKKVVKDLNLGLRKDKLLGVDALTEGFLLADDIFNGIEPPVTEDYLKKSIDLTRRFSYACELYGTLHLNYDAHQVEFNDGMAYFDIMRKGHPITEDYNALKFLIFIQKGLERTSIKTRDCLDILTSRMYEHSIQMLHTNPLSLKNISLKNRLETISDYFDDLVQESSFNSRLSSPEIMLAVISFVRTDLMRSQYTNEWKRYMVKWFDQNIGPYEKRTERKVQLLKHIQQARKNKMNPPDNQGGKEHT